MKRKTKWIVSMLAGGMVFLPGAVHAEEESYLSLNVGYEFSSGNYGTASTTDIVTIPVSARYETGPWALKLTVPYTRLTGDGNVTAGGMHSGRRQSTSTVSKMGTTQSGLGDVETLLTYKLYSGDEVDSGIELGGRVKFGTASKQLGTGQNDYAAQLFGYHAIAEFTPSIMLGYEVMGSSPQLLLNNVYYGSVGSSYTISDQISAGMEYKYVQRVSAITAEQKQATLFADFGIGKDVYLHGYLSQGYSDGSPDTGYGLSISVVY